MTTTEKAKLFFEQLPKSPTAADYIDAAKATGDISDIIPAVLGHAQAHGIDASEELKELQAAREPGKRKTAWTAAELLDTEFPVPRWIVPDLLPTGFTILAGNPKLGKSWLALAFAIGVSSGGQVLGKIPVEKKGVLYLALEDTGRRLKDRLLRLNATPTEYLRFHTEWDKGAAGLVSYLRENPEIRLCILDTWGRFGKIEDYNSYSETTGKAAELKAVADELDIAILAIHHTRKNSKDSDNRDWLDSVLGSQGFAGTADTTIVMRRRRSTEQADFLLTGRDVTEKELVLSFELDGGGGWTLEGDKREILESAARQEIFDWLKNNGAGSPKKIFDGMRKEGAERKYSTLKVLLRKMAEAGILSVSSGTYSVPVSEGTD